MFFSWLITPVNSDLIFYELAPACSLSDLLIKKTAKPNPSEDLLNRVIKIRGSSVALFVLAV